MNNISEIKNYSLWKNIKLPVAIIVVFLWAAIINYRVNLYFLVILDVIIVVLNLFLIYKKTLLYWSIKKLAKVMEKYDTQEQLKDEDKALQKEKELFDKQNEIMLHQVYTDAEIISSLIDVTDPLSGPTNYMVKIQYEAPNDVEPPVVYFSLTENRKTKIFEDAFDWNTTLCYFDNQVNEIRKTVDLCLLANAHKSNYEEERKNQLKHIEEAKDGELPF